MRETKPTESKIRALLIDDDQGFSSSVKRALADDFEVTIAPDGRKGFALLSANDLPGVILLDMELPEISGLELLKMLKQRYPELPVVMLTGNS
jgi:DNA-binding NtrC family response regulator